MNLDVGSALQNEWLYRERRKLGQQHLSAINQFTTKRRR